AIAGRADATRLRRGGDALARVERGVEVGEALAVGAALERVGVGPDGTALEAAEPLEHVLRPADRLAELAVADDVDPDLGLLPHHFRHGPREAGFVGLLVERLAALLGAQEILQRRRTNQP